MAHFQHDTHSTRLVLFSFRLGRNLPFLFSFSLSCLFFLRPLPWGLFVAPHGLISEHVFLATASHGGKSFGRLSAASLRSLPRPVLVALVCAKVDLLAPFWFLACLPEGAVSMPLRPSSPLMGRNWLDPLPSVKKHSSALHGTVPPERHCTFSFSLPLPWLLVLSICSSSLFFSSKFSSTPALLLP